MSQQRAEEIFQECRTRKGHGPWSDQLDKVMTADERAYVKQLWDTMPGNTCFVDAFLRIRNGRV